MSTSSGAHRMSRPPTAREAFTAAVRALRAAGLASPEADARALLALALGQERVEPVLAPDLDAAAAAQLADLVARRCARVPLQHLTGRAGFRHLILEVRPGVFVPRPETEVVTQAAVDEASAVAAVGRPAVVVDLCTGAGGIAVSVAHEVPGTRVLAVDVSAAAVELTRANAAAYGAAVEVRVDDVTRPGVLAELDGQVDVVVSNPPYIPPGGVPLEPEVAEHDPAAALWGGGPDGLDVPRAVLRVAARVLRPGGLVVAEHAEVQAAAMRDAARDAGFVDVVTGADLTGRDRFVRGRRPRADDDPRRPVVGDSRA